MRGWTSQFFHFIFQSMLVLCILPPGPYAKEVRMNKMMETYRGFAAGILLKFCEIRFIIRWQPLKEVGLLREKSHIIHMKY